MFKINFLPLVFASFLPLTSYALTNQLELLTDYNSNLVFNNTVDKDYDFNSKDIKLGTKSEYVSILQEKYELHVTGVYDKELEKIVKDTQSSAGLNPSGVIDQTTWLKVYGVSNDKFKELSKLSESSWNEILSKDLNNDSDKMIVINVPSMKLFVYSKNGGAYEEVLMSKVIVGRKSTQTPLEDFSIISLKFNPTWTPTPNMLKRNVYKNGKTNVAWLKSHHLKVFDKNGKEYDYSELGSIKEPRFTQPLGEYNALGNLKFETTSEQDIYLHDTNERHLFAMNTRLYSSGCVRVQNYKELASILSSKPVEYIDKGISKRETKYEKLNQKIPVYFDYSQLLFVDGKPYVYPDVYSRNK